MLCMESKRCPKMDGGQIMKILEQKNIVSLFKKHPPHPTKTKFHSCGDGLCVMVRNAEVGGAYRFLGKMNHLILNQNLDG